MKKTKKTTAISADPFQAPGYERSRWAYIAECAFEYFIALLVADQFLTKLLLDIGESQATITVIQSLISLAFLFQLASIFVVQRITNVKKVAAIVHCVGQLFFTAIYFVPFLPYISGLPEGVRTELSKFRLPIIIACLLIGYFGNYLVTSVIFRWGNSFVDPKKRARYAATKEMISLLSGVVITLVMSKLIDMVDAADGSEELNYGFIFAAAVMLVVCAIDFTCLILMKNRITEKPRKSEIVPFDKVLKTLFKNKGFVYVVLLSVIWYVANYATVGAISVYKQDEAGLHYDLMAVTIINTVGALARFALSRPIGRYTDKRSYSKGIILGLTIVASAYFVNIFTTPQNRWILIVYTILYNIAQAGIGQNLNNIIYNFVEEKYFVQATAIKNSVAGTCGFLAGLLASQIWKVIPVEGITIAGSNSASGAIYFSFQVYAPQLLSVVSLLLCVGAIVFIHLALEKQKVIAR